MRQHPTAVISSKAKIAQGVEVGPYAVIEEGVSIAKGVKIYAHAYLTGRAEIGEGTEIHMGAVIGHVPQDWSFKKSIRSTVRIGKNNLIREYVTIHRGSKEGSATIIGDDNFLMAHSHVAHDCQLGNGIILANGALLGGHVSVGDKVFISGNVVVHQFARVGKLAIVGGGARIIKDVPLFMLAKGDSEVYTINSVGLRRAGYRLEQRQAIKEAFRLLYRSGRNVSQAMEILQQKPKSPEVEELIQFIRESKRGICGGRSSF